MRERRNLARFSLRLPARVIVEQSEAEAREISTRDISAHGVFLVTDRPEVVGTLVRLELLLPADRYQELFENEGRNVQLKVRGVVIRKEIAGMAVRFDGKYRLRSSVDAG